MKSFWIDRALIVLQEGVCSFDCEYAADIEAHWVEAKAAKPELFNGVTYFTTHWERREHSLIGTCQETCYAAFLYWQANKHLAPNLWNGFGAPVPVSSDGAILLGRMASHTANAGQVYFPSGSLDAADVSQGYADFDYSIFREFKEETGQGRDAFRVAPLMLFVATGGLYAVCRFLHFDVSAVTLRERMLAFIYNDKQSELDDIIIARSMQDLKNVGAVPYILGVGSAFFDGVIFD